MADENNSNGVNSISVKPVKSDNPLIFISHDSRDADLAEAFANLLLDASGGILKSFRSSDRKGTDGIEFGAEWYRTIMDRLDDATDVVALLTERSLDRPWILYETGVAKGKLNTTVFGLAVGVPLSKVSTGPFAQFQNSDDNENSITKLVLQLIRRHPQAAPREEAVRRQVQAFLVDVNKLLAERHTGTSTASNGQMVGVLDENPIAKLFEEVKVLVRDMPERVAKELDGSPRRQRKGRGNKYLFELANVMSDSEGSIGLLIILSLLRDDLPWMYDLGLEYHRAQLSGDIELVEIAYQQFRMGLEYAMHSPISTVLESPDSHELLMIAMHAIDGSGYLDMKRKSRTRSKSNERSSDTSSGG